MAKLLFSLPVLSSPLRGNRLAPPQWSDLQAHWPAGQELLLFPLHPSVRAADVSCHLEQLVGAAARLSGELAPSWASWASKQLVHTFLPPGPGGEVPHS